MCALVYIDVGTPNLKAYLKTLRIIQTHVEENELEWRVAGGPSWKNHL